MAARPSGGYAALRPACAGCWIATRYDLVRATVKRNALFPPNSRYRNVRPVRSHWVLPLALDICFDSTEGSYRSTGARHELRRAEPGTGLPQRIRKGRADRAGAE